MQSSSVLFFVSLVLPCAAWADLPAVPTAAEVAAAPAENSSSTATGPAMNGAAARTPAQEKKLAAEEKLKRFGVNGYKPQTTKAGDVVYCKMVAPVGSRFESKQCRTFEQLRDEALNGTELTEKLQHTASPNRG